jgi:D-alanyl-D-alanine carboxypeptidase/D-alanyl-D-alanine-endopeptidase (penicillin-binding protein 4)
MKVWFTVLWLAFQPMQLVAKEYIDAIPELKNAGVLVLNKQGMAVLSAQETRPFIPASTTKLLTAWLALTYWGDNYHFKTDFYVDQATQTLWVKGSGDPFLVSEELQIIAQNLALLGLENVKAIGLDGSHFQPNLKVPGAGTTTNPYDAIPGAIAVNFNTIAVKKRAGNIVSAEPQTPLTLFSKTLASQQHLSKRTLRINTGAHTHNAEQYFAELLAAFLRQQGIVVGNQVVWGKVPEQAVFYRHSNSKNLAEIIQPMLKYSTNFIANQLILMMGEDYFQRPANFSDVQAYMTQKLTAEFNWKNSVLKDGAGLSRDNRLSPEQLVQLLEAFRPWKHLLPEVAPGIYAKSGTLNKVSTLAGYIIDKNQHWNTFCLMMTQDISHNRRNQIASKLSLVDGTMQFKTLTSRKQPNKSMK